MTGEATGRNIIRCEDCGERLPNKVCRSNAGYYVGKECPNCGPYSRESGYHKTYESAEKELKMWND
mgnify:CR=1 FL=1